MNIKPLDLHDRPLRDLRISVTDRCNFRCSYCMPKSVFGKDYHFLRRTDLLSYEEVERLARIFIDLGVQKIRLTGGEPLLRHDLERLIEKLARLSGLKDLALTTNASLLSPSRVTMLCDSGIDRINISLDALDESVYKQINEINYPIGQVLDGIDNVMKGGFKAIKINVVVQKGINDNQIIPMTEYFRGKPVILRFIEFMDVGNVNMWDISRVVSAKEIIDTIQEKYPLAPLEQNFIGEVASRWKYLDGAGEIGIISSISKPFCSTCSRARLSAVGELYTCLFATQGFDFREQLRRGCHDSEIVQAIRDIWCNRGDRYSELRQIGFDNNKDNNRKVEMSYIGG